MRILLSSNWFAPSVGGVETVSKILAEEFTKAGHLVTVITNTAGGPIDTTYKVMRRPSAKQMYSLARNSDIVLQNMISLRTLVGILPAGRKVVVTHQSWMRRTDGTRGVENYLKLLMTRFCTNVSISQAIAETLPVASQIINNPFEESAFASFRDRPREKDIVFMGRLVSDKGCDQLLNALSLLRSNGLQPSLTIIGDGPDKIALMAQVERLGLSGQITFLGTLLEGRGEVVARHRIMAIPSRWNEPFGIVALEGIAAGCSIVASDGGGLAEAAGPCGLYFSNGNVEALAICLEKLLLDSALQANLVANGPAHLEHFHPARIAQQYLDVFARLLR